MRRLVLYLFLLLSPRVMADQLSEQVVDRMRVSMNQSEGYEASFSVSAEGMDNVFGKLRVFGDRFRIEVGEQIQFGDGEYRYEVNAYDKQVIIEQLPEGSVDMFTNPSMAFEFGTELFDMTYDGIFDANGHRCEKIVMSPKSDGLEGINKVLLYVDAKAFVPRVITYDYNGVALSVNIDEVVFLDDVRPGDFEFRREEYSEYEIIDFR